MRARPAISVKCARCGKPSLLRRLRGSWSGLVRDLSHPGFGDLGQPIVQLPRDGNGYTLDGFRCWRCRGK